MPQSLFSSLLVRFLCIVLGTALLCAVLLAAFAKPFAWVFFGLALGALACVLWIPRVWATYAAITALSFFATCGGVEYYLTATSDAENTVFEGRYSPTPDPELGYVPKASDAPIHSKRFLSGKQLYKARYTTRPDGWRITPEHPGATRAVLFFGCSYTMGEAVNDAESYPWIVGELLGPQWQVYNFGFSGYGPHHFLALLQSGRLDHIFRSYKDVQVFFLNIWGHELRSGGYSFWDRQGPRYVIRDGRAVRAGDFSRPESPGWWSAATYDALRKLQMTQLCTKVMLRVLRWNSSYLKTLQTAILVEADELIRTRYPGVPFTVLVYPGVQENVALYEKAGLRVRDLTPALPGKRDDPQYVIPLDGHPTPLAQRLVAEHLAALILDQEKAIQKKQEEKNAPSSRATEANR